MRHYLVMAAMATLVLSGCNKENEMTEPTPEQVSLQVCGNIKAHVTTPTRVTGTAWEVDDAIGIYMLADNAVKDNVANRKYTFKESTKFEPTTDQNIFLPEDGASVNFNAYYPYQELKNNEYQINIVTQTNQNAIDLMTAQVTGKNTENATADFQFSHRLSKIELTIVNEDETPINAEELTVKIDKQRMTGTYKPVSDELAVSGDATAEITIPVKAGENDVTAEAILLPNDIAGNQVETGRKMTFTLNETTFTYTIPDTHAYNAGKKITYAITIKRNGVAVELTVTSNITDWGTEDGFGDPIPGDAE